MEQQRERRGQGAVMDKSDHDRLVELERKVERLEIIFDFLTALKIAVGHLWAWLDKNARGQR